MADVLTSDLTPPRHDINAVAGTTAGLAGTLFTEAGTPLDLTGWSGVVVLSDGAQVLATYSTTNGGLMLDANGNFETLAFVQTAAWRYAEYVLTLKDPNGNTRPMLEGTVRLL